MLKSHNVDGFKARVFAGLVVAMTIVVGSLAHAVYNIQAFA